MSNAQQNAISGACARLDLTPGCSGAALDEVSTATASHEVGSYCGCGCGQVVARGDRLVSLRYTDAARPGRLCLRTDLLSCIMAPGTTPVLAAAPAPTRASAPRVSVGGSWCRRCDGPCADGSGICGEC